MKVLHGKLWTKLLDGCAPYSPEKESEAEG